MHHPYWALLVVSAALIVIPGTTATIFWTLQKIEDYRTARIDRQLAQLELQHRPLAHHGDNR